MSLTTLSVLAFGAGVLSFLSPCVLPLVPSYLAYLAGVRLEDVQQQPAARWRVSQHALWFVCGVAVILTTLGAAAGLLGSAFSAFQQIIERLGGVLLILFGIALTGWVRLPWISWDHRLLVRSDQATWWRAGLMGLTFGASWSACSGPILGAILVLAAVRSQPLQGAMIMLIFALGQVLLFLLVSLVVDRAGALLRRIRRYTIPLSRIGAVIMILIGFFLLMGLFSTTG
jgi:cytochrome c-type biogenesis protein